MKGAGACAGFALVLACPQAFARPQWNAGAIAGACVLGDARQLFEVAAFCGSARVDTLFLRERTNDFGVGPYATIGTAAFADLRLGAGASLLLPVIEDFPLVVSVGGLVRDVKYPGVAASAFWGVRSYNFHGTYNLSGGALFGVEHTFAGARSNSVSLGIQVDAFVFAIPVLLLIGALH